MDSNDGPINVSESNEDGVGGGCRWSMESSCRVGEATINVVLAQVWGNMRMYDKSFVLQDVGFLLDHNSLLD